MSKPGKSLKGLCKKLGVSLTVKRGKKRVYKSIRVLKAQCAKKKKRVKRRRKFGRKINYSSALSALAGTGVGILGTTLMAGRGMVIINRLDNLIVRALKGMPTGPLDVETQRLMGVRLRQMGFTMEEIEKIIENFPES